MASVTDFSVEIGVKTRPWRQDQEYGGSWREARQKALERDRYQCRGCGFVSKPDPHHTNQDSLAASGYMEAHHINDNHDDHRLDNLVTLCPLCHACFTIGLSGRMGGGVIVWLPEVSQGKLNLLVNAASVAILRDGQYSVQAKILLDAIRQRKGRAETVYHKDISDPAKLGSLLHALCRKEPELYRNRRKWMGPLRYVPNMISGHYREAVVYWSENVWLPETQWPRFSSLAL